MDLWPVPCCLWKYWWLHNAFMVMTTTKKHPFLLHSRVQMLDADIWANVDVTIVFFVAKIGSPILLGGLGHLAPERNGWRHRLDVTAGILVFDWGVNRSTWRKLTTTRWEHADSNIDFPHRNWTQDLLAARPWRFPGKHKVILFNLKVQNVPALISAPKESPTISLCFYCCWRKKENN